MSTNSVTNRPVVARRAAARRKKKRAAQQRPHHAQPLHTKNKQRLGATAPSAGLVSPYDGTTPGFAPGATAGYPLAGGLASGAYPGVGSPQPQVNATNQSALAPNGNVNQTVTNENKYETKYINIIASPFGMGYGAAPFAGAYQGTWGMPTAPGFGAGFGNPYGALGHGTGFPYGERVYVDPSTGALMVQHEKGITGWFKRLFRGY